MTPEAWSWLRNFPALRNLNVYHASGAKFGADGIAAQSILDSIANPEKLQSLELGNGVWVSGEVDFQKLSSLKTLTLSELDPETQKALMQNNPGLERLLKSD
jgi:hypothetical protein